MIEKQIRELLKQLHTSDAIALIERIGKDLRRKNSIRLSKGGIKNVIDAERPDLIKLKENETGKDKIQTV
jgi:hypothetical protein